MVDVWKLGGGSISAASAHNFELFNYTTIVNNVLTVSVVVKLNEDFFLDM